MLTITFFFFFNDTATTEIYTLSLHDALPIFDAAVGVAAQVDGLVDVDTHLTPELARGEDGVHGELVAVSVEGVDVVPAGDEQLLEAVAVHVGHDDVLIPHAEAVARLAVVARRPAGTNGAGGLEDGELAGRHPGGLAPDDLELAVFIQVGHRQAAELVPAA